MRRSTRGAFSLVEIMLATAVLAGLGAGLMGVLSSNSQVAARAGEAQMATLVGLKAMDRMLTQPVAQLSQKAAAGQADGELEAQSIDDFSFSVKYHLEVASRGLVKISLTVTWQRPGNAALAPGQVELWRFAMDPTTDMDSNDPIGRSS